MELLASGLNFPIFVKVRMNLVSKSRIYKSLFDLGQGKVTPTGLKLRKVDLWGMVKLGLLVILPY